MQKKIPFVLCVNLEKLHNLKNVTMLNVALQVFKVKLVSINLIFL